MPTWLSCSHIKVVPHRNERLSIIVKVPLNKDIYFCPHLTSMQPHCPAVRSDGGLALARLDAKQLASGTDRSQEKQWPNEVYLIM